MNQICWFVNGPFRLLIECAVIYAAAVMTYDNKAAQGLQDLSFVCEQVSEKCRGKFWSVVTQNLIVTRIVF